MKATIAVVAALAVILASGGPAQGTDFPGDLNGDGWVGHIDLDIVLADWGSPAPWPCFRCDDDDFVGQTDLDYVLAD